MSAKLFVIVICGFCWKTTGATQGDIESQGKTTNITVHWHWQNADELINITRSIQELKVESGKSIQELKVESDKSNQKLIENERRIQEFKTENGNLLRRLEITEEVIRRLQIACGLERTDPAIERTESTIEKTEPAIEKPASAIEKTEPSIERTALPNCCTASLMNGKPSGVFNIRTSLNSEPFSVYCLSDDKNDKRPWTIIQKRDDGLTNFNRNWTEYVNGFGNAAGDYWIGLRRIYEITNSQQMELWIKRVFCTEITTFAFHTHFLIGGESEQYYVKELGETSGPPIFPANQKDKFFIRDKDDNLCHGENCAGKIGTGWWNQMPFRNLNRIAHGNVTGLCTYKYVHLALRPYTQL